MNDRKTVIRLFRFIFLFCGVLALVKIERACAHSRLGDYQFSSRAMEIVKDTTQTLSNKETTLKAPYIRKAEQLDSISVWIVDGVYIRNRIDIEFTNYGQHYNFKYIPKNEFWIDKEGEPDELEFFVAHLLVEHRLMAKGVPYEKALEAAGKIELAERKKAGDVQKLTADGGLPDAKKVHVRLWKKLASPVSVWIVNGRLVRSVFDVDFTEGGHDYVYEFVPLNEVWIDNDLDEAERPYVLFHELHERNLMAKGWDYDRAHNDASKVELHLRRNPNELHSALVKEGWE